MSHEIEKMAYVREKPWHGLGENLQDGQSLEVWRKAAGLDWKAEVSPVLFRRSGEKQLIEVDDRSVLYRGDNFEPLSIVSANYKIVQPATVIEFFRDVIDKFKSFKMETAGCLQYGRKIWALARADKDGGNADDPIARYLLLATSFDQTMATTIQQTSVRVVCYNTLMMSVAGGIESMRITHGQTFNPEEQKKLLAIDKQWSSFLGLTTKLIKIRVDSDKAIKYFTEVYFPASTEVKPDEEPRKSVQRKLDKLMDIRDNAPGGDIKTSRDTAWGLVNAVTYHEDHLSRARTPDNRLTRAWFGEGERIKERAVELALALN